MTETRVLVAARLSRLVKGRDQLSIEYQDQQAEAYAREGSRVIVATASDPGVSGSVSPFKRPKLAPFLTQSELINSWDEIVASAIDRLGRNARDMAQLKNWCEDNGKRITILQPRLHWPPAPDDFSSPIVWAVLEQLAEIELRQTKQRYADKRQMLRDSKSMLGHPCWGFKITGPKLSKTITPDPAKLAYLLKMVEMAEHGDSQTDIGRWLDAEGAKPTHGGKWSQKSVGQILRNESLYGVFRENGKILLRHQGVISKERWDKLQERLDANPKRRGPTRNDPAMMTDWLFCATCGRIMHTRRLPGRMRKDGTRLIWVGYRCDGTPKEPSTCQNMLRADDIEPWTDAEIISSYGDTEIIQQMPIAAKGYADEVKEIDSEIDALDKNDPDWLADVTRLYAERARLMDLGTVPAHMEDFNTGIRLGRYWPTMTAAGKRDYACKAGVKVYASASERRIEGDPSRVTGQLVMPSQEVRFTA
jgi:site-specific DNA recombinase